jgi:cytochrome c553
VSHLLKHVWKFLAAGLLSAALVLLVFVSPIGNRHPQAKPDMVTLGPGRDTTQEHLRIVAHGKEVVGMVCARCHGLDLSGVKTPEDSTGEVSLATRLLPSDSGPRYTENDLFCVLRDGKKPDGNPLGSMMPALETRKLSDDDIHAVWRYSQSLPPHHPPTH